MNKKENRNEQMVVALRVVGCELNKETRIRRSKIKDRGKKKAHMRLGVLIVLVSVVAMCVCWGGFITELGGR